MLLSWYALRPCTPPPACMCYPAPLATYSYTFCCFHQLQGFVVLCASFFVLLSCYALRGEGLRLLLPTPIPFPFSINSSDVGSYVLLSLCFFLGTAALPPATPHPLLCLIRFPFLASLSPFCHEHRVCQHLTNMRCDPLIK